LVDLNPLRLEVCLIETSHIEFDVAQQGGDKVGLPTDQANSKAGLKLVLTRSLSKALQDQIAAVGVQDLDKYTLSLSVTSKTNLDRESAKEAGIPEEASCFAYCFGALSNDRARFPNIIPQMLAKQADPNAITACKLLTRGGFVYFNHAGDVVGANVVRGSHHDPAVETFQGNSTWTRMETFPTNSMQARPNQFRTINFGHPVQLSDNFTKNATKNNRWVPITLRSLKARNVLGYTWLFPAEMEFAPFGAFCYRMTEAETWAFPIIPAK